MALHEGVEAALSALRAQVEAAVRAEQLLDQLTGLPNGAGLEEVVARLLDQPDGEFWIAFVEVDHFKRVNDEFGYDLADSLLCAIANQLRSSGPYFSRGVQAFRQHGDEFFLLGPLPSDSDERIADALDLVGRAIGALKLPAGGKTMRCTVTIGWTTTLSARGHIGLRGLNAHSLNQLLERTVSAAKRKRRGSVLEHSAEVEKFKSYTLRADCPACHTRFSADVPEGDIREGALRCPHCGEAVERPPRPVQIVDVAIP